MCTAISWQNGCHYFGRNLDLERSYGECVAVTPRRYPFSFRCGERLERHHAMIGMAHVSGGYPLYYEATNEHGLSIAGLNFPDSAVYHPYRCGCDNVAPFELPPWLLGRCTTLKEARAALTSINIWHESFSSSLPASPLHWLIADKTGALVAESTADGLHLYDNDEDVLTNEPPFPFHRANLRQYAALTPEPLPGAFSRGAGSFFLPGGLDSASRFVRAAFTVRHALAEETESASVSQFFHMLSAVEQSRGCVHLGGGAYELTLYSCCCNTDTGTYYYATYDNRALTAVELRREDPDGDAVVSYPLRTQQRVERVN